jgi:hypothetical protein
MRFLWGADLIWEEADDGASLFNKKMGQKSEVVSG